MARRKSPRVVLGCVSSKMRVISKILEWVFVLGLLYFVKKSAGWAVTGAFLYLFIVVALLHATINKIVEALHVISTTYERK